MEGQSPQFAENGDFFSGLPGEADFAAGESPAGQLTLEEAGRLAGEPDFSWSAAFGHQPVMPAECLAALAVKPEGFYVDATLGGGGHSRAILAALGPRGRLLALDLDPEPLRWARVWSGGDPRLRLARASFADLPALLADLGPADGLLADLGPSSRQLLGAGRGFSFARDEPLDMRLDPSSPLTALDLVTTLGEEELSDIFRRYGEERAHRRLARLVVEARRGAGLTTAAQLAAVVQRALSRPGPRPRLHPATRAFMALRLAVNRELEALERLLAGARGCLKTGGRLAVVSFHSLEDRLVKEAFRDRRGPGGREPGAPWPPPETTARPAAVWRPLGRKPVRPSAAEAAANPRARSAKLRSAEAV